MAKKRVIKKKQKVPEEAKPHKSPPLMDVEGQYFQELVNASNRYTNALKQKAQYEFIVKRLINDRKKIQQEEIKLPITITLIPNLMFYSEYDKKKVLKIFDEQIQSYNTNLASLEGQLEHRYEDYMESAVRNKEFINNRFKNAKAKSIVPLRDIGEKDEELLFEAEFSDLKKDSVKREEFKKANKEAIKRNVARKKKA